MVTRTAAAALLDLEHYVTTTENPEIDAMAAIARILSSLPDEAARMRVMRWSFGRFSDEFKRPVQERRPAPPPRTLVMVTPMRPAAPPAARTAVDGDFSRQIEELEQLFPDDEVREDLDTSLDL